MKFKKDDVLLTTLAILIAIAITIPIFFVIDLSLNKMPEKALTEANAIEKENTNLQNVEKPQTQPIVEKPKEGEKEKEVKEETEEEVKTPPVVPITTTSVGKNFYRNSLSKSEINIYDLLYSNALAFNDEYFTIPIISVDSLLKIHKFLSFDKEELFYLDTIYYTTNGNGYVTRVKLSFNCGRDVKKQKQEQIDAIVNDLVAKMESMSEYEKVKYAHDYVIQNTEYLLGAPDNQYITSVFLGKQSVCAGYSRAFQHILRRAGVYCIYLTGKGNDSAVTSDVPVGHAWNLVRIDNNYYFVDTTFDDPTYNNDKNGINFIVYDYLNIPTAELLLNHSIDEDIPKLPNATSIDSNYFVKENLYFTKYDNETVNRISKTISDGNTTKQRIFTYKFSDATSYSRAADQLIQNGKQMNTILTNLNLKGIKNQIVSNSYSYLLNDKKYIITFVLSYK